MVKKIVAFTICFIMIISALSLTYAADYRSSINLSKIIDVFNNCAKVKEYQERNMIVRAIDGANVLYVTITQNGETKTLECEIDGNYLFVVATNNIDTEIVSEIWDIIVNSAKEVPGYKVSNSVRNDEFGISYNMRISDINDYIKVEDLEYAEDTIEGNEGEEQFSYVYAGDVYAYGYKDNNKNVILLTEDEAISGKSYKSLMSIVEVMFNSKKAVNYFKQNYESISVRNKEFEGVKIEVNPEIMQKEVEIMTEIMGRREDYNFMRVTIDKDKVNAKINNNSSNNTSNENDKNNDNKNTINNNVVNNNQNTNTVNAAYKGNLPKTGEEIIALVMISGMVVLLVIIIIGARKYKNIK